MTDPRREVAPSRVRGLKQGTPEVPAGQAGVAPSRVRGLKRRAVLFGMALARRTLTGAWIETR